MAEIIEFKPRAKRNETTKDVTHIEQRKYGYLKKDFKKEIFTDSPISMERWGKYIVVISFMREFFNISFMESKVRNLSGDERVDIYPFKDYPNQIKKEFAIELLDDFGPKTDKMLSDAIEKIIELAYMRAFKSKGGNKMLKSHTIKGLWLTKHIESLLEDDGIESIEDLCNLSRDELCAIHGMTSYEVALIERGIISKGLKLSYEVPPIF